eukprot:scaffold283254_cov26-Tisochrysis_lutea.AAC.1
MFLPRPSQQPRGSVCAVLFGSRSQLMFHISGRLRMDTQARPEKVLVCRHGFPHFDGIPTSTMYYARFGPLPPAMAQLDAW